MFSRRMLFMVLLGAMLFAPAGVRGEDNQALVRRWYEEVMTKGNLAAIGDFIAPTFVGHLAGAPDVKSPDGFKQRIVTLRTAFPDAHFTIEEMLSEGNKVAVRITGHGTHKGTYLGVAPTGKELTWTVFGIFHIANGKFQETWQIFDLGQQLGLSSAQGQGKP